MHRFGYPLYTIILLLLSLVEAPKLLAQQSYTPWYVSFNSGVSIVDFNESGKITPTFRIFGGYDPIPGFGFRAGFYIGRFKSGNKKNYLGRSYDTHYMGMTLEPRFNFLSMFNAAPLDNHMDIYGFGGPGLFWYNVKTAMKHAVTPVLEPYLGINNKSIAIVYSLGLGVKVNLTPRVALETEYSYHMSNSELIDGYPTIGKSSTIPYKPHEYNNDSWTFLSLGFSIRLGKFGASGAPLGGEASVDPYGYGEQLQRMNQLIDQNLATVKKSNEELDKTTTVLNQFQRLATELQLQRQQERITKLQEQLDSLGTMRSQLDSLKMMQSRIELIRNSLESQQAAEKSPQKENNVTYYVIAGEFLSRDKADNLLSNLQTGNYPNASIVMDSKNVWYMVSYAGGQSKEQAQNLLRKVKAYDNPLAWIYTKKL